MKVHTRKKLWKCVPRNEATYYMCMSEKNRTQLPCHAQSVWHRFGRLNFRGLPDGIFAYQKFQFRYVLESWNGICWYWYLMAIWNILRPFGIHIWWQFGIFCGSLIHCFRFGMLYQCKIWQPRFAMQHSRHFCSVQYLNICVRHFGSPATFEKKSPLSGVDVIKIIHCLRT
jgi:hypothetical protein